jgi:hypothetical protein
MLRLQLTALILVTPADFQHAGILWTLGNSEISSAILKLYRDFKNVCAYFNRARSQWDVFYCVHFVT